MYALLRKKGPPTVPNNRRLLTNRPFKTDRPEQTDRTGRTKTIRSHEKTSFFPFCFPHRSSENPSINVHPQIVGGKKRRPDWKKRMTMIDLLHSNRPCQFGVRYDPMAIQKATQFARWKVWPIILYLESNFVSRLLTNLLGLSRRWTKKKAFCIVHNTIYVVL